MTQPLPDINVAWSTSIVVSSGAVGARWQTAMALNGYGSMIDGVFSWDIDGATALFQAYKAWADTQPNPVAVINQWTQHTLDDPQQTQFGYQEQIVGWDDIEATLVSWNMINPSTP